MIIQIPEEPRSVKTPKKPRSVKISMSEPNKSVSGKENSTQQHMASMTGHPNNCLYIISAASIHTFFNKELFGGLMNLDRPLNIQTGGKSIHLSQIGSLHQALHHLPLSESTYHYSENAVTSLLSFSKLADKHYIICNTEVDDEIYIQSKDVGKYL